ncbi:hypothetical protein D9M68_630400 [compost metagenome]
MGLPLLPGAAPGAQRGRSHRGRYRCQRLRRAHADQPLRGPHAVLPASDHQRPQRRAHTALDAGVHHRPGRCGAGAAARGAQALHPQLRGTARRRDPSGPAGPRRGQDAPSLRLGLRQKLARQGAWCDLRVLPGTRGAVPAGIPGRPRETRQTMVGHVADRPLRRLRGRGRSPAVSGPPGRSLRRARAPQLRRVDARRHQRGGPGGGASLRAHLRGRGTAQRAQR